MNRFDTFSPKLQINKQGVITSRPIIRLFAIITASVVFIAWSMDKMTMFYLPEYQEEHRHNRAEILSRFTVSSINSWMQTVDTQMKKSVFTLDSHTLEQSWIDLIQEKNPYKIAKCSNWFKCLTAWYPRGILWSQRVSFSLQFVYPSNKLVCY